MKLLFSFIITLICSCVSAQHPPLETVSNVELNRYLGKWYEIARFEHSFQKGCTAVSATYSLRKNGTIKVVNICREENPKGKLKKAVGRARVVDKTTNAKLSVQFFLKWLPLKFLSGKYWIIALGDNYEYAMVGEPSREYLWILSRKETLDKETFDRLVDQAQSQGFDTSKLLMTRH
jgi:apolipoprotein D and lipocalin family protein